MVQRCCGGCPGSMIGRAVGAMSVSMTRGWLPITLSTLVGTGERPSRSCGATPAGRHVDDVLLHQRPHLDGLRELVDLVGVRDDGVPLVAVHTVSSRAIARWSYAEGSSGIG